VTLYDFSPYFFKMSRGSVARLFFHAFILSPFLCNIKTFRAQKHHIYGVHLFSHNSGSASRKINRQPDWKKATNFQTQKAKISRFSLFESGAT
ncbi:MAG: hypothetical protein WCA79_14720, partial [Anaerolineales bacterium]